MVMSDRSPRRTRPFRPRAIAGRGIPRALVALAAGAILAVSGLSSAPATASPSPSLTASPTPSPAPTPSPTATPSPSPVPTPSPTATPSRAPAASAGDRPPTCAYGDVPTTPRAFGDWDRTLLDTTYRLPAAYAPPDLVPVARARLAGSGQVRRLVIADLADLARAARAAGIPLVAVSGYRSYGSQAWSFAYWVGVLGYTRALLGSARAGHSEHQLGTTIDFASYPGGEPWYFGWFGSRTAAWLAANAWRFGFVLTYPAGKTALTCYGYEPWHYRYVGRDTAAKIHASRTTLREFIWRSRTTDLSPGSRSPATRLPATGRRGARRGPRARSADEGSAPRRP